MTRDRISQVVLESGMSGINSEIPLRVGKVIKVWPLVIKILAVFIVAGATSAAETKTHFIEDENKCIFCNFAIN